MSDPARERELEAELERWFGQNADRGPELARLRGELERVGNVLRARAFAQPRDEARLVQRVLARTTREDLSVRGDLALFMSFLRARLAASPALRLVAASLALHLVAAPVVAYWILREPEPERPLLIHIEPPSELPFDDPAPPPLTVEDELLAAARAREARENTRAELRYRLRVDGREVGALVLTSTSSAELRLLAHHVEALRSGHAPAPEARPATPLANALWLELELDRTLLAGDAPTSSAREAAAQLAEDWPTLAPELAPLVSSTLLRAWSEGWIDAAPGPAPAALSPAWFKALGEAFRTGDPAGAAALAGWLAAQGVK